MRSLGTSSEMSTKSLDASWVVQKFGGTSLGKVLETISGKIVPQYLENDRMAIVCSARSGKKKSEGTTRLLLEAIDQALIPSDTSKQQIDQITDNIRDEHFKAVDKALLDSCHRDATRLSNDTKRQIAEECEQLRSFLYATQVSQFGISQPVWLIRTKQSTRPSENFLLDHKTECSQ